MAYGYDEYGNMIDLSGQSGLYVTDPYGNMITDTGANYYTNWGDPSYYSQYYDPSTGSYNMPDTYTPDSLASMGITTQDLMNAGFGASDLAWMGFTQDQLSQAGFTDADLQSAFGTGPGTSLGSNMVDAGGKLTAPITIGGRTYSAGTSVSSIPGVTQDPTTGTFTLGAANTLGTLTNLMSTPQGQQSLANMLGGGTTALANYLGSQQMANAYQGATNLQREMWQAQQANQQPWLQAGQAALPEIQRIAGQAPLQYQAPPQPTLNANLGLQNLQLGQAPQYQQQLGLQNLQLGQTPQLQTQMGLQNLQLAAGPQYQTWAGQGGLTGYDPATILANSPDLAVAQQKALDTIRAQAAAGTSGTPYGSGSMMTAEAENLRAGNMNYLGQIYNQMMSNQQLQNQANLTNAQFYNQAIAQGYSDEQARQIAMNQSANQNAQLQSQFYNTALQQGYTNEQARAMALNQSANQNATAQAQFYNQALAQGYSDEQARQIAMNQSANQNAMTQAQYGNTLAQQQYQNALTGAGQQFQYDLLGRNAQLSPYLTLAGYGTQATNNLATLGSNYATGMAQLGIGGAQTGAQGTAGLLSGLGTMAYGGVNALS